ncbi:MAG: twin-arginine translocase TatA/TatE family subunit [candidate division WOR-3 bacterium]
MNLGWQEILLILLIVLLLFGARKIPELARSLGKGVKEFKKGLHDIESSEEEKDKKEEKQN